MSSHAVLVEAYIALRRRLGFDYSDQARLLREFARFADGQDADAPFTIDLALRWAQAAPRGGAFRIARRLSILRGFARYCANFDPAVEVPPAGLLGHPARRRPPHICSDAEIAQLLRAAAGVRPRGGLRPHTYVTLFSLLATTGLRIGEACGLAEGDVDLETGLITIREAKCHKTRLLPLHRSALEPLGHYCHQRDRILGRSRSAAFFRTEYAPSLTRLAAQMVFHKLRRRLGWTAQGRVRTPRLHDLRHTFAVRCLVRWSQEGVDVDRKIGALATYLGHVMVSGTYWYLTAVPELMSLTSERFQRFAARTRESVS